MPDPPSTTGVLSAEAHGHVMHGLSVGIRVVVICLVNAAVLAAEALQGRVVG